MRENVDSCFSLCGEMGIKLKPDTFDRSVPLRKIFAQFGLIARTNRWTSETKTAMMLSYLKGKARAVLGSVQNLDDLSFEDLKLELRFGETQFW